MKKKRRTDQEIVELVEKLERDPAEFIAAYRGIDLHSATKLFGRLTSLGERTLSRIRKVALMQARREKRAMELKFPFKQEHLLEDMLEAYQELI